MTVSRAQGQATVYGPDLETLTKSFRRSLLAANLSPATIRIYTISVDQFRAFLEARGMPLVVEHITREHVEEFITDVLRRNKPSSAETRYRGLKAFFKWAVEEGEIKDSPLARVRRPSIPESPPEMLSDDQLKRLLETV